MALMIPVARRAVTRVVVRARYALVLFAVVFPAGCRRERASGGRGASSAAESSAARPEVNPVVLNRTMPFRYPPALYAERAQGDVTLRLYVDSTGQVVNDSIRLVRSSNVPLLDSAALQGARELRFTPAMAHGTPTGVSILFPVYFRHPEATPPPGDSARGVKGVSGKGGR